MVPASRVTLGSSATAGFFEPLWQSQSTLWYVDVVILCADGSADKQPYQPQGAGLRC